MLVPDAWFRVLCSRCLVSRAWFQVLGSGCLVRFAWSRLTEYKVICYKRFVFNSLKRCYLLVFFLHLVFSLLFASFNFTKLQFIVVSSLMFFDSYSRSLFNYGFHNIYPVLSWFGVLDFGCLVPGGRFKVRGGVKTIPACNAAWSGLLHIIDFRHASFILRLDFAACKTGNSKHYINL